jgi:hypothetical protein
MASVVRATVELELVVVATTVVVDSSVVRISVVSETVVVKDTVKNSAVIVDGIVVSLVVSVVINCVVVFKFAVVVRSSRVGIAVVPLSDTNGMVALIFIMKYLVKRIKLFMYVLN